MLPDNTKIKIFLVTVFIIFVGALVSIVYGLLMYFSPDLFISGNTLDLTLDAYNSFTMSQGTKLIFLGILGLFFTTFLWISKPKAIK